MDIFVEKIGKLSQKFLEHIKVCIVSRTLVCVGFYVWDESQSNPLWVERNPQAKLKKVFGAHFEPKLVLLIRIELLTYRISLNNVRGH